MSDVRKAGSSRDVPDRFPCFVGGGLINDLPFAVVVIDAEQTVLAANKCAADFYNLPLAQLLGCKCPGNGEVLSENPSENTSRAVKTFEIDGNIYCTTDTPYSGSDGEQLIVRTIEDVTDIVNADIMLRRQRRSLQFNTEISRRFNEAGSLKEKLEWLLNKLTKEFGFDSGGIYLPEHTGTMYKFVCQSGFSDEFVSEVREIAIDGPEFKKLQQGEILYAEDYGQVDQPQSNTTQAVNAEGIRTLVVVPLHYEGNLEGSINLASHSITPKRDDELLLMDDVGRNAAAMVANARLMEDVGRNAAAMVANARLMEDVISAEERFRAIVENSTAGIMGFDRDGRIILWNDACERIYGWMKEEIIGTNIRDTVGKNGAPEKAERMIAEVFSGKRFPFIEDQDFAKDGSERWTMASKFPLYGPDGNALLGISTIIDVTAQRDAEQRAALLAEVAEQVADAVHLVGPERRIQYVNKAYEEMFGYCLEDIVNTSPSILNPNISGPFEASIRSAADKGISSEFELPQKRKDGSIIFTRLRISPIKNEDGEITAWVGIHTDITERRKMEEALRQSEEMFRLIGENSTDAVILIVDDKFIYVNPEASRITGYDEEELLSGNMWIGDIVAPEQRDEILDRYRRRMACEDVPNEYAMDFITREGERRTLDVRVTSFELYGRTAVLFCARDVTERKRMEQRMLVAQKAESVQRLAGGIAHDFNNLLVGIMGNATLLQSEMGKDERYYSILVQIESASRQAARLTGQLLAYARGGRYQPTVLDSVQLIEESLPLLRASCTSGIELITEFGDDVPSIEADRSQIEQVLLNLCLNAAEAMSFQGKLTIGVNVEENENGRWVRICFEDTGPGLPKKVMNNIFDPFFSTKGTGRGMGMAAVYGIVQNHGGEIKMENLPGSGAAFTMYLPAVDKEPTVTSARKSSADTGGGERILVVDDDDIIRDVAREILIRKGYDVVTAFDGDDALRKLDEIEGISLVILDIVMPGMGGQEVCRLIRQRHPDLKVVFSSGYNEPTADDDNETGEGFIQKPYSSFELTSKVREILDYHG